MEQMHCVLIVSHLTLGSFRLEIMRNGNDSVSMDFAEKVIEDFPSRQSGTVA